MTPAAFGKSLAKYARKRCHDLDLHLLNVEFVEPPSFAPSRGLSVVVSWFVPVRGWQELRIDGVRRAGIEDEPGKVFEWIADQLDSALEVSAGLAGAGVVEGAGELL